MTLAADSPIDLTSLPPNIEFGQSIEGKAQIIVTCDMLGLHPHYFNEERAAYDPLPAGRLWRLALPDCNNLDDALNITLPGIGQLRRYRESGLDNLGYQARVFDQPALAEYLDNPGILILLLENSADISSALSGRPNRVDLVRRLTGNALIKQAHINWLKKVRPGNTRPADLAPVIRHSILRIPAYDFNSGSSEKAFFKLFAHQPRWTPQGLAFARMLVRRPDIDPTDLAWLLRARNGDCAQQATVIAALRYFELNNPIQGLVSRRITELIENRDLLTPDIARQLTRITMRSNEVEQLVDLACLFLVDDDIPVPIISGNDKVKALDSLAKIRRHAKLVRNCLWTPDMLAYALSRSIDLYSVAGENLYTISVCRRTLDIQSLQPQKSVQIKPADLALISRWFEEGTRLPR